MLKTKYNVIGVMSGTSLDGIDLVFVNFHFDEQWQFQIFYAETVAYSNKWRDKLKDLVHCDKEALELIDLEYTQYLAHIIRTFIDRHKITQLDAISSHGHTALHQPDKKLTYQIGNLPIISTILGEQVVCDFRVQDVDLGGQGAPLVPIGDKLLFSSYAYCLNLGGFANISTDIKQERIAYDICPVNIVLNHYAKLLGYDFDNHGKIASTGVLHSEMLNALNGLSFYKAPYPKSLGLEWVRSTVLPLIDSFKLNVPDILNTFCEHIALQISNEINATTEASVLLTGGGAYNSYLINRINNYSVSNIVVPQKQLIEFKEALIFAFLGVLKLRNEINCLKSVTGASRDHSSGRIFQP